MPTQKTFKRRVRTRSAKTGESYTAARAQLVRRADARATDSPPPQAAAEPSVELPVADEAMRNATGRAWTDWFALLDDWGATERRHPDIARWLREAHNVDGWWAQSITVGYERARGMRAKHQMATGFVASVNRTVSADLERARSAFTDPMLRGRWLPDITLEPRPTRAATTARFDWPDPPSILVAYFTPKGETKTTVSVQHERLPDEATADRLKSYWRERLLALKDNLEESP